MKSFIGGSGLSRAAGSGEVDRIGMRAVTDSDTLALFVCQPQRVVINEKRHRLYRARSQEVEARGCAVLFIQLSTFAGRYIFTV